MTRTSEVADLPLDQPGTSSAATSKEDQSEGEYLVKTLSSLEINNDSAVAKLTREVPAFTPSHVEYWFFVLEANFHVSRIRSESTKFFHTLAGLPPNAVARVKDVVYSKTYNYSTLKTALIRAYAEDKSTKVRKLLSGIELEDKPSLFYSALRSTADGLDVGNDILFSLWLQKLPSSIRPVCAGLSEELPLDKILKVADNMFTHLSPSTMAIKRHATASSRERKRPRKQDRPG